MEDTQASAADFVDRLHANTDALFADQISDDTYHATQRRIWGEIAEAGRDMHDAVLTLLRSGLAGVGS